MGWLKKHSVPVVIIFILLAALIFVMGQKKETIYVSEASGGSGVSANFVTEMEEGQEPRKGNMEKGIEIPGYSDIPIPAGETTVNIELVNPEVNDVYFQISFVLTETNEKIYESKLIEPGVHVYEIELEKPLEEGEYDLTVVYDTYAMDGEYTPRNSASVGCKLFAI